MAQSRFLPRLAASVALLAGFFALAHADYPGTPDEVVDRQVKVQMLIAQGNQLLLVQNNPAKAVELLETNLYLIDGNKTYLLLLRDAYKKHIVNLYLGNHTDLAQKFLSRLRILDPDGAEQILKNPAATLTQAGSPTPTPAAPFYTKMTGPAETKPLAGKPGSDGKTILRGKGEEDDPFAPENVYVKAGAKMTPAQALLADAVAKFDQQKYAEARLKFEQAYQADSKILATAGTADRWAYCRFQAVVDQLQQKAPAKSLKELEGDVKAALALKPNPEVTKQGQKLLEQIAQLQSGSGKAAGQPGPSAVKHLGKNAKGWQVAETAHFRIYHNQPTEFVEQVAQVAEQTRVKMTLQWFGAGAKGWRDRCEIYLHPTGKDYSKKTGVNPQSPGHSRIETDNGTAEVICRQIELRCDNPDLLAAVLPHETTHVILAGQFGPYQVPRWVDEGVAVLSEPAGKVNLHLKNLPQHYHNHELFSVRELIELKDYPHAGRIGAFYAQSVSLVDYLTKERGAQVFTKFVNDGLATGYENALRKHYNIQSYSELQGRWVQSAFAPSAQGAGYAQK